MQCKIFPAMRFYLQMVSKKKIKISRLNRILLLLPMIFERRREPQIFLKPCEDNRNERTSRNFSEANKAGKNSRSRDQRNRQKFSEASLMATKATSNICLTAKDFYNCDAITHSIHSIRCTRRISSKVFLQHFS